jgi:hypothetical protein
MQGFLYAPDGLPNNHPGLDQYFVPEDTPYDIFPIAYWDHPDVLANYLLGEPLPQGHPVVMDLVRSSVFLSSLPDFIMC